MAGIHDQLGVVRNYTNGYKISQERAEKTESVWETFLGYCNRIFAWFEKLFKNWQLLILGVLACLIIWKKL